MLPRRHKGFTPGILKETVEDIKASINRSKIWRKKCPPGVAMYFVVAVDTCHLMNFLRTIKSSKGHCISFGMTQS